MKEVNSASSSLEIEVELEDVLDHTRIRNGYGHGEHGKPKSRTRKGEGGSEAK